MVMMHLLNNISWHKKSRQVTLVDGRVGVKADKVVPSLHISSGSGSDGSGGSWYITFV
jgi:hypothetical protein